MSFQPLDLPFPHSVFKGLPMHPSVTLERMLQIQNEHVSLDGDVYICTYNKSGTTWLQHIVNQLFDEPQGKGNIADVVPWLSLRTTDFIDKMVFS